MRRSMAVVCTSCGDEFELESMRSRRPRLCGTCERISRMEREAIKEWEIEQGWHDEE